MVQELRTCIDVGLRMQEVPVLRACQERALPQKSGPIIPEP